MKKIAIFVEGHTEQAFITKLISEILTRNTYSITSVEFSGPKKARRIAIINASTIDSNHSYYFMIYNCRSDSSVKSDIIEQYSNLVAASYNAIIGIRDVFPNVDIEKLRKYILFGFPKILKISINIILAVMEIESWFIAEENHYANINPKLNRQIAEGYIGFDILTTSSEAIHHPAEILNNIYHHVNYAYKKKAKQIQRTVDAIDYSNLYCAVRNRNNSLNEFLVAFESVL